MSWEIMVINSEEIRQQADDMICALQEENTKIQEALTNAGSIQQADTLNGEAWQKLKEGSEDYLLILQGLLCANESAMSDSQKLRNLAGEQQFYGEDVAAAILYADRMIDTYQDRLEELKRMKRAAQNLNMPIWWIDHSIRSAQKVIQSAENGRSSCINQIELAEGVAGSTADLYQESEQLYAAADQGISSLESGESVLHTGDTAPAWVQTLQQAWDKRQEKLEIQSKEYLKGEGFTDEQLSVMQELGYGYAEVKDLWLELLNEQDREFFKYLMDGTAESYAEAFEINPMELSDEMTLVLADYAYRLLPKNLSLDISEEELQRLVDFNNAILSQSQCMTDENGTVLSETYRDKYLEKLCIGSTMQVQGELVFLTSLNPEENEEAYDILYGEYEKKFTLMNLWTTESLLIQELTHTQEGTVMGISISNLSMSQWNADFTLNHIVNGEMKTECVETTIQKTGSEVAEIQNAIELEEMRKEHEQIIQKGILKTIANVGLLVLKDFSPEITVIVDLMTMMLEGDAKNIEGLESLVKSHYAQFGIESGNSALTGVANTYIAYINSTESLNQLEEQLKMEWFGSGYTYEVTEGMLEEGSRFSVCGVYEPNMLRRIEKWNQEGLRSFMDWDESIYADLKNEIENDEGELATTKKNALLLIDGGGDILNMNFTEFQQAVNYIDHERKRLFEHEEIIEEGGVALQWKSIVE